MSQSPHDPDLTAVERALTGLAPSAGAFNRDVLMFAAGRTSARRGWGWLCATAVSTFVAAASLAALFLLRPAPVEVVRYVPVPATPQETAPRSPEEPPVSADGSPSPRPDAPGTAYLTLHQRLDRWSDAGPPSSATAGDERPRATADLLDLPPDVRGERWLQRRTAMLSPGGSP
jgi:hypothetical protein